MAPRTRRHTAYPSSTSQWLALGAAAPQVVAHRLARMAVAGPSPSARDRREFSGMVLEKQVAFAQAWTAMLSESMRVQQQWLNAMLSGTAPPSPSDAFERIAAR